MDVACNPVGVMGPVNPGVCDGRKVTTGARASQAPLRDPVFVTLRFRAATSANSLYRLRSVAGRCAPAFIKKDFYMANKRARDSESGRFIPIEEAKRRPKETTVETIRKPSCPKKKEH